MDYYFDSFPDEITKWDVIRDIIDLYLDDERNDNGNCSSGVQLLPRQDVMVYGIIPKMEQILYIKCKECKLVFNPRDILLHKTCPGKHHSTLSSKKKVKNKGSIIKKSHLSFPPPPSFKKSSSLSGSVLSAAILPETKPSKLSQSKWSKVSNKGSIASRTRYRSSSNLQLRGVSTNNKGLSSNINSSPKSSSKHSSRTKNLLKSPSKHTSRTNNSSESPSQHASRTKYPPKAVTSRNDSARSTYTNSRSTSRQSRSTTRYKRSRKSPSNAKIINEINHDIPRRVRGGPKGPCTRSFTSSNNRIQFQQSVQDRSKNIIKRKTTKAKSSKNFNPSPNGLEEKDFFCQSISYVPLAEKIIKMTESAPAPVAILTPISGDLSYSHENTSLLNNKTNVNCCEELCESEDKPECTWRLAKSLQKVAPLQLNISGKDYGVLDEYSIEMIRNLYRDFGILECSKYEDPDLDLLDGRISYLKNPCQTLLKTLVEKFCEMEIM